MTIPAARLAPIARVDPGWPAEIVNFIGRGMHIDGQGNVTFDVPLPGGATSSVKYLNLVEGGFSGDLDVSGNTALLWANINNTDFTNVSFAGCTALTELRANSVTVTEFDISGCTALQLLYFSSSGPVQTIDTSTNTALNNIFAEGGAMTSMDFSNNPLLEQVDLAACQIADPAVIDAILIGLDENGLENGFVDLSGGTNAVPGPAGQTAVDNLIGKGWTVNANSP